MPNVKGAEIRRANRPGDLRRGAPPSRRPARPETGERTPAPGGRTLSRRTLFLAASAIPLVLGGLVGLADYVVATPPALGLGAFGSLLAASLGATLAFAGALPAILLATAAGRPRRPGPRLGGFARGLARVGIPAFLLLLPVGFRTAEALRPPAPARGAIAAPENDTNVLLLSIDTIRAASFGAAGNPHARTPHFDRLSRDAVTWIDCLAASPWTFPSLASVQTGHYPGEHHLVHEGARLADAVPTLAEQMRSSGRQTAAFVSNPWLANRSLFRGFDSYDVAERIDALAEITSGRLYGYVSKAILRTFRPDAGVRISELGIEWIERASEPWFLWLHYFDPHLPNWPDAPYDRLFGPPPAILTASPPMDRIRKGQIPGGVEAMGEIVRLYEGEVAYTDEAIGRVWDALEERALLDATLVVLVGDHGEEFWDHDGFGHGHTMFDEVVRVPFLVRSPGGGEGRLDRTLARHVDVTPTLLAAAEISVPDGVGFSGVNLLASDGPPDDRGICFGEANDYGPEQKFLRRDHWKLIWWTGREEEHEERVALFDVRSDPAERSDVADAHGAVADSLLSELQDWIGRVGYDGDIHIRYSEVPVDPSIHAQLKALGYIQ